MNAPRPITMPNNRKSIEAEIARHLDAANALIALLDQLDGDSDLEPALGSINPDHGGGDSCGEDGDQRNWAMGGTEDLEGDYCEGPIDDDDRDSGVEFSTEHQLFGPPPSNLSL